METLAKNLRDRAKELNLSNAEVARRLDLSERRYAHYVAGRNEPDLALLLRIAAVLRTTPNALLGLDGKKSRRLARDVLMDRLAAAAITMTDDDLKATVVQAEAIVGLRRK